MSYHYILSTDIDEAFSYAKKHLGEVPLNKIIFASNRDKLEAFAGYADDKAHILESADVEAVNWLKFVLKAHGQEKPYPGIAFEKKKHTFICIRRNYDVAPGYYSVTQVEANDFSALASRDVYGSDIIIDDEGRVLKNRLGAIFNK